MLFIVAFGGTFLFAFWVTLNAVPALKTGVETVLGLLLAIPFLMFLARIVFPPKVEILTVVNSMQDLRTQPH